MSYPLVPILDVKMEAKRGLFVRIGRSTVSGNPLLSISQWSPDHKCVTAAENCEMDEAVLDERMADQ